jgi:hypothetical protein
MQRLAPDDEVAAGQLLRQPPQLDARKDHLRAGRADVDADRSERDVVLQPQARRRRVVFAADIVMVVVVIGFPILMRVQGIHAQEVILEAVRPLLIRIVSHFRNGVGGHLKRTPLK